MHVPDHFLDPATSIATAAAAATVLTTAVVRVRRGEGALPPALFAATTAAVFGLQMLNYPVGNGTSGHLIGGALAAAILGPALGMLAMAVVLVVQCLVFADGGLTALGTNLLLMAVVGTLVGWGVSRTLRRVTASLGVTGVALASAAGGLLSVVTAAAVFTGLYALGGTVDVPLGVLAADMVGVHVLIGLGEAAITGVLVAGIAVVAPGVLALDRDSAPALCGRRAAIGLGGVGLLASGLLAPFASSYPDGLEATAAASGFAGAARDHFFAGMPLADYGEVSGVAVGLAGLIGVVACFALAAMAARAVRPRAMARA